LIEWKRIPSSVLERKETREILLRAFESLPRIYREVFVLRDVEELSISETAKVLGIQEVNVEDAAQAGAHEDEGTHRRNAWLAT